MCGIFTVLDIKGNPVELRKLAVNRVKRLRHRGPDWSGVYSDKRAVICHERLAIVDVTHGAQPLVDKGTGRVLAVNGEIYNHLDLRARCLKKPHDFQTASDCEPILYLYDELGPEFVKLMNGIFAFVIYDPRDGDYFIARDHIGINPLYWGRDGEGNLFVSSEMKALVDVCPKVEIFPPGHYYKGSEGRLVKWYEPAWAVTGMIPSEEADLEKLRRGSLLRGQTPTDVRRSVRPPYIGRRRFLHHRRDRGPFFGKAGGERRQGEGLVAPDAFLLRGSARRPGHQVRQEGGGAYRQPAP